MRLLTQNNSNSNLIPGKPDGMVDDHDSLPILDSWTERTAEDLWVLGDVYLFIYSISFNVIQPMWLHRQIQTHQIADLPKRRKQANRQKKIKQHK
jgi:hypothetical protein